MEILCRDNSIVVCIKPAGVLSTDGPGGMPELLQAELGTERRVRTVHRLDRVVSGVMVYALSHRAASELSRQIRDGGFEKRYLAVIHWRPRPERGVFRDLLLRNTLERKTYVVKHPEKGAQEAVLNYETLGSSEGLSLVRIELVTGRTHQIRAQFACRGLPLAGDRKYGPYRDECALALWSQHLRFTHPDTGRVAEFSAPPPEEYPWTLFAGLCGAYQSEESAPDG